MTTMPLTGAQHEIRAGGYRAVVTGLGAGLRELTHDGHPIITGHDADELPPHSAGQLLAPWPNRIDGGRYRFDGTEHQLALSEPGSGNAIHGLTRWLPWVCAAHERDSVLLTSEPHGHQGYPFCVQVDARYRLDAAEGLRVEITARNLGGWPAPWGTGSHPYLTLGTESVDGLELTLPAARRLPVDDRGIPSGPARDVTGTEFDFRKPRLIGQTRLDHAFTDLERDSGELAWVRISANGSCAGVWADAGYNWLQVFTGDPLEPAHRRKAIAVEPMSCPPNAFASGEDLVILPPGGSVTHAWGITLL